MILWSMGIRESIIKETSREATMVRGRITRTHVPKYFIRLTTQQNPGNDLQSIESGRIPIFSSPHFTPRSLYINSFKSLSIKSLHLQWSGYTFNSYRHSDTGLISLAGASVSWFFSCLFSEYVSRSAIQTLNQSEPGEHTLSLCYSGVLYNMCQCLVL